MKRHLILTGTLVAVYCVTQSAAAAVPNLSLAELRESADVIAIGTVTNVKTETVAGGADFVDERYIITFQVNSVEKGPKEIAKMTVETWRPKSRPDGFAGPQGQEYVPAKGDKARFYCRTVEGGDGFAKCLEPNGILKLGGGKRDKGKGKPDVKKD